MRLILAAAATAGLLLGGNAVLAGPSPQDAVTRNPLPQPDMPNSNDLQVGIGVICNTTGQAETYVRLRAGGTEISSAVTKVNKDANDPKACGVAAIAFKRGKTMESKSLNGKSVDIVRINVLAGYNGHGWTRMPGTTQYAVIQSKGIEI